MSLKANVRQQKTRTVLDDDRFNHFMLPLDRDTGVYNRIRFINQRLHS